MVAQSSAPLRALVLRMSAPSGKRTMRESQVSVIPSVRPNPGSTPVRVARLQKGRLAGTAGAAAGAGIRDGPRRCGLLAGQIDLVEGAVVVEMGLLGLLPAAEDLVNREQSDLGQLGGMLLRDGRVARAVEVLGDDLLALV